VERLAAAARALDPPPGDGARTRATESGALSPGGRAGAPRHAAAPASRRAPARVRPALPGVAGQVAGGPRPAHLRAADRPLPVRRDPVVLDAVRPGRGGDRAADALDRSGARARRALVPRRGPGQVKRETREGEVSATAEVPCGQYCGGVDTTPLFVALAGAYARRTGDRETVDALWPALRAAAGWMERSMSRHPDGLLAYQRGEVTGLANQGWKDSNESVCHDDGTLAEGP